MKQASDRPVALVTGANRGIGLETCRQLLALGMRVALSGRDEQAAQKAIDELLQSPESPRHRRGVSRAETSSDNAMAVRLDVTDQESITDAKRAIESRLGPVDVLVNNAAILLHENSVVLEIPASAYRATFETNVWGVVQVCRVFVPGMVERGYGRVVNVSSGAGQLSRMSTYAPAYSMSKAALNAFTRLLAAEVQGRGVLVNAVDPGWVRTDMGGPGAPRSLERGAETIVWLATLPDKGPTGGFFRDKKQLDW